MRRPADTCLVVQKADGAVLVCSDGDRLRWVTDHAVDQLTACSGRQTTTFEFNLIIDVNFSYSMSDIRTYRPWSVSLEQ